MKPGQYHGKDVFSHRNGVDTACCGKSYLRLKKGMIEDIICTRGVELHPAQSRSLFRCGQRSGKPHVEDFGFLPEIVRNGFSGAGGA